MPDRTRIARYLMCNILGKQADPDWTPDERMLGIVAAAIDGYVSAEVARDRAAPASSSREDELRKALDGQRDVTKHVYDLLDQRTAALRAAREVVSDEACRTGHPSVIALRKSIDAALAGTATPAAEPPRPRFPSGEDLPVSVLQHGDDNDG